MSAEYDVPVLYEVALNCSKPMTPPAIQERFVSIENSRVRYLTGGDGPPVIFVHGLFGYSFSWRFNLPAVAQSHTVYALDLPGAGFSERIRGKDCSVPALAATLLAFFEELKIAELTLVGSSHGGAAVIEAAVMAREHDIRISKLVLVSPVNPWSSHGRLLTSLAGTRLGTALFPVVAPCILPFHAFFVRRMYGDVRRIAPGTYEGYAKPIALPGSAAELVARVRHWRRDVEAAAAKLPQLASTPTLIVWGGRDRAVHPSSAQPLLQRLPHARLAVLPGAGHLPYEELPDEFNKLLLAFLQGPAAGVR